MKTVRFADGSLVRWGTSAALTMLLVFVIAAICAVAASAQTIYCASEDGRRTRCPVDTRAGVRLVEQKSDAACIQGRTWGFKNDYIWVDRGCRADFEVGDHRGDRNRDENRDRDRGRDNYSHGSVTWVGKVDHDIKLVISGVRLDFYVQSGKSYGPGRYSFTSAMPRNATVTVQRIKGRDDVTITEQPSSYNKYSAVIRITDSRGGSDNCEVVISW
jgi:hypothetical protein